MGRNFWDSRVDPKRFCGVVRTDPDGRQFHLMFLGHLEAQNFLMELPAGSYRLLREPAQYVLEGVLNPQHRPYRVVHAQRKRGGSFPAFERLEEAEAFVKMEEKQVPEWEGFLDIVQTGKVPF